jgi:hypothetical protein
MCRPQENQPVWICSALPSKGTPVSLVRLQPSLRAKLALDAARKGITFSAHVRGILTAYLESEAKNVGVLHPRFWPFDRAVKRFIVAVQADIGIAGLPGKQRRDELEGLSWEALREAIKSAKAQEDPVIRLLAMRVATALMRVELAIVDSQDKAHVDELVEELENARDELARETQTRTSARKKT